MKGAEEKYYEALQRLKSGKTKLVKGEYLINLDTIALECGMKRGSVRRDRLSKQLLEEFANAASERETSLEKAPSKQAKAAKEKLTERNREYRDLRDAHDNAILREMNLMYELMAVKDELERMKKKYKPNNVVKLSR